jgi:RNA polymerase sigma factor (sigma-70 family)
MEKLTQLVIKLQGMGQDNPEREVLFTHVYNGLQNVIESTVESFKYSLKGDVHEGYSEALEVLMKAVNTFKYEGYEFKTYYKRLLRNRLIDLVRSLNAEKVRHNTSYNISINAEIEDDEGASFTSEERLYNEALMMHDEYLVEKEITFEEVLQRFEKECPEEYAVIDIMIQYSAEFYSKKDTTSALAKHYGSDKYTGAIQKRVSRIRESLKRFGIKQGYEFHF